MRVLTIVSNLSKVLIVQNSFEIEISTLTYELGKRDKKATNLEFSSV